MVLWGSRGGVKWSGGGVKWSGGGDVVLCDIGVVWLGVVAVVLWLWCCGCGVCGCGVVAGVLWLWCLWGGGASSRGVSLFL